jgi:nucleoside transporter
MTHRAIAIRLSVMMFLEYAVRGMWYPYLANYLEAARTKNGLGFSSGQTGWVMGFAPAVGAITAPFIAGQVADRYFNAERALATLHVIAAILLFATASATVFAPFFAFMLLFSIAYMPTQSLTNSVSLTHLTDRERRYPRVRLWGTLGWIVSSSLFTYVVLTAPDDATNVGRMPNAMRAAAVLAVLYAMYALLLVPKTPPGATAEMLHVGGVKFALRAFELLRDRSVLVLTLIALPVAAIHTAYYLNIGPFLKDRVGVPLRFVGPAIALSQSTEVILLFCLGRLLRRFGYLTILTIGAAAQAARFIVFAIDPAMPWVLLSLTLHGVAFACFFTTAILYIERVATPAIRHSAQMVFGIVLFGIGPALAGPYSQVFDRFTINGQKNYAAIWTIQAIIAGASAVAILLFFRPSSEMTHRRGAEDAEAIP